jgi:SAM-dependent methyltransferase
MVVISDTTLDMAACEAYESTAAGYDLLTGGYSYERWLGALERLAFAHGLRGRRLLDIACGTGASFIPMLTRGYLVTGCDISPQMLERARRKAPQASLHVADMRRLPRFGAFDLITCLDDALNYLLSEDDLESALSGIAANLDPVGLAIWDLNTIAQYRGQFSRDQIIAGDDQYIGWAARPAPGEISAGDLIEIAVDVFTRSRGTRWERASSVHRQRHWPPGRVAAISCRAGLRLLSINGQHRGAVLGQDLDELTHTKAIYVACLAGRSAHRDRQSLSETSSHRAP